MFLEGFLKELFDELEEKIGCKIIGNKLVFGIEIFDEFG